MKYSIHQIQLPLNYEVQDLKIAIARKIHCDPKTIDYVEIIRRSLDARKKPCYVVTAVFEMLKDKTILNKKMVIPWETPSPLLIKVQHFTTPPPVVVGAGPAGLMAAWVLAKAGKKPIVMERGSSVEERRHEVSRFWSQGEFKPQSNVLYGEGGAGLFSDGKLTARSKDRVRVRYFFETLVECGADTHILVDAEPHIGSDILSEIVPRLRKKIIEFGGEFRFNTTVSDFIVHNNSLEGIRVNDEEIPVSACILATGHSARDIFRICKNNQVLIEPKPFALGVRLEIPQIYINNFQYGQWKKFPGLDAASFRLTRRSDEKTRACYTFCMCPGGIVIPCASSEGMVTTNGMSMSNRGTNFGNAAFLVPVTETDLKDLHSNGIEFQETIEKKAFKAGGNNYSLAGSSLTDFLNYSKPHTILKGRSFKRTVPADIHSILPDFISDTLCRSIPPMLRVFKNLQYDEVSIFGAETRSSGLVRIVRNEMGMSCTVNHLYPAGEGAGYAGGIVSSAVDGINSAQLVLENLGKNS
jgi:uncharacterized protein